MKRILIYGPPFAGKLTLLDALARREAPDDIRRVRVALPYTVSTGQQIHHYLQTVVVRTKVEAMAFCTLSREVFSTDVWESLVKEADGVVLALNSTPDHPWQTGNLVMLNNLVQVLGTATKPGCVLCTKADQIDATKSVLSGVEHALKTPACAQWPVFYSRSDQEESLTDPLYFMAETVNLAHTRTSPLAKNDPP